MSDLTLLVLAAGMGSRFGGLKQLTPVGPSGETLLEYSVFDALRAGFTRVVFVIRESFAEEFAAKVTSRFSHKVPVDFAFQCLDDLPAGFSPHEGREKPWGTGHAVWVARHLINGPFAVINADDFYGHRAYSLLAESLTTRPEDGVLIGYPLGQTLSESGSVSRGICRSDESGYLQDITEIRNILPSPAGAQYADANGVTHTLPLATTVSMNLIGAPASVLHSMGTLFTDFLSQNASSLTAEFYLPAALTSLIQSNSLKVRLLTSADRWMGVTYPADKPQVVANLQSLTAANLYPSPLFHH